MPRDGSMPNMKTTRFNGSAVALDEMSGAAAEQAVAGLVAQLEDSANTGSVASSASPRDGAGISDTEGSPLADEGAHVVGRMSLMQFSGAVRRALEAIDAGQLRKVVLARRSHVRLAHPLTARAALARLSLLDPATTRFLFSQKDALFLGASPELLVERRGPHVFCDALAGTAVYATDSDALALLRSNKDRREHAFVVEAIRSALATCCVDVLSASEPSLYRLRTVTHLHTAVIATASPSTDVLDVVAALHPTPAVCGTPRERALRFLLANEATERGWYAAPVGWFDAQGNGSFAVALRSALIRGHDAWLYAGAGIVAGSEPEAEYRETEAKLEAMLSALGVES